MPHQRLRDCRVPFKHWVLSNEPFLPLQPLLGIRRLHHGRSPDKNQFHSEFMAFEGGLKCLPKKGPPHARSGTQSPSLENLPNHRFQVTQNCCDLGASF